jgi:hypothetical protein
VFSSILGLLLRLMSFDLGGSELPYPRILEEACMLGSIIIGEDRSAECLKDRLAVSDDFSGRCATA